jgi:hypothetical protein
MHKNAMKCNETLSKWCKNKYGASKIIDTFETYQVSMDIRPGGRYGGLIMSIDFMGQIDNNSWGGHGQRFCPMDNQWISGLHVRPTCQ